EGEAMDALAQLADHSALLAKKRPAWKVVRPGENAQFLNEAQSLNLLKEAGIPVVDFLVCRHTDDVLPAWAAIGPGVMKACSRDLQHKSDVGLVTLNVGDPVIEFHRQKRRMGELGVWFEGVIVARKAPAGRELALGARIDP